MELLLAVGLVIVFIAGAIVRQLYPQGTLGSILNNPIGLLGAFAVVLVVHSLVHALLIALLHRHAQ